jgi:hypothetical protein
MRLLLSTFLVALFLSIPTFAQTREQAIEKFNNLKNEAKLLEQKILAIDKASLQLAKEQGFGVFRILPREKYDVSLFETNGGNAYYSFFYRYHDYGHGSDIELSRNVLSVATTGLIYDLGNVDFSRISKEDEIPNLLSTDEDLNNYDTLWRIYEKSNSREGVKIGNLIFKRTISAEVGHTYIVRSANRNYYDILAAFNVIRKDNDGSLVIFWKLLEQFDSPLDNYNRSQKKRTDEEMRKTHFYNQEKFKDLKFEVENGVITLSGKVDKKDAAYAVQTATQLGAKKVINLLEYK